MSIQQVVTQVIITHAIENVVDKSLMKSRNIVYYVIRPVIYTLKKASNEKPLLLLS